MAQSMSGEDPQSNMQVIDPKPTVIKVNMSRANCRRVTIRALLDPNACNYLLAKSLLVELEIPMDYIVPSQEDAPDIKGFLGWLTWLFVYPCFPQTSIATRFAVVDDLDGLEKMVLGREEYRRSWKVDDKGVLVLVLDKTAKKSLAEEQRVQQQQVAREAELKARRQAQLAKAMAEREEERKLEAEKRELQRRSKLS